MAVKLSTGAVDKSIAGKNLRDIFHGGLIKIYSGAAPADANDAATGQLLCTISNASATVKVKQKHTVTPVAGTANAADWYVTINGIKCIFKDDGTPTVAEICAGLKSAIDIAQGDAYGTTPAVKSVSADDNTDQSGLNSTVTVTDNGTDIEIEADVAGVPFSIVAGAEDGGGSIGTGTNTAALTTADAYGLYFETDAVAAGGELEKDASQTWSGVVAITGVAGYFRLVKDSDDGSLSTTQERLQGNCGTSNTELQLSSTSLVAGATETINSFKITQPKSA